MKEAHQPWLRRLQHRMSQETAFLPKRLVLLTLLLLGIYVVLLIRSELRTRNTNNGLVEATLNSKLIANYRSSDQSGMTFAPLSLALVQDKIRDENPYLPEDEVATLWQTVIAAAQQPIIAATPTPGLRQPAVIQSAAVITEPTATSETMRPNVAVWLATEATRTLATNNVPTPAQLANRPAAMTALPTPIISMAATPESTPASAQGAVVALPTQVIGTPTGIATVAPVLVTPTLPPVATNTLPTSLATAPLRPTATATFATATPPPSATWTPVPTATPTSGIATAIATATTVSSTALVIMTTPTATSTAINFLLLTAKSTATQTALPTVIPTATPTIVPTATPTATNTPLPTNTPAPSPTATPLPTATASPTPLPVIGTPPAVLNVTARVEDDQVYLEWTPIFSVGVVGYNIYHSHTEPVARGTLINSELLVGTSYIDTIKRDGSQSFYVVTAVNQLHQESLPSQAVTVNTPDLIPPSTPANFALRLTGNLIQIDWQANQEADLAGYNVYRSNHLPVDRTGGPLNGNLLLPTPAYQDTIIQNGLTYYYVFTAVDLAGNESLPSIEAQIPTVNLESTAP